MPFQPGHKRLGGRVKGQVSKKTQLFKDILAAKGFNTLDRLTTLLDEKDTDEEGNLLKDRLTKKDKAHIYCELMQYEFPKRKAVEVEDTTPEGKRRTITIGWADDEPRPTANPEKPDAAAKKD